jgi:hypothetical protein
MTDSWGDGWDGTVMRIYGTPVVQSTDAQYSGRTWGEGASVYSSVQVKQTDATPTEVFQGRLVSGDEAYQYACLQKNVCYTVEVDGGTWESEIKWEVREVEIGVARDDRDDGLALAKGLAPETCQFSVPNSSGDFACPVNCGVKKTSSPSAVATGAPSASPTIALTDEPSVSPTPAPSLASSLVATGAPSLSADQNEAIQSEEPKRLWQWNRGDDAIDESYAQSDAPSLAPSQIVERR